MASRRNAPEGMQRETSGFPCRAKRAIAVVLPPHILRAVKRSASSLVERKKQIGILSKLQGNRNSTNSNVFRLLDAKH